MATPSANAVRSSWRGLLALVLLVPVLGAAPAQAQTVPDLEQGLQSSLAEIASAVVAVSQGDATAAAADLGEASALLEELATLAAGPAVKAEMGRLANKARAKIRKAGKRVRKARTAVGSPKKPFTQQLKALKAAYADGLNAASTVSTLVVAEEGGKAAGFHKPGDLVTFRARAADGTPCTEIPAVTVQHQGFPNVVDLSTVATWPDGTITMAMGEDQGVAYVTVTACGRSGMLLLYNYGPKLAHGFPPNLPLGTYALSVRITGFVDIPETPVGTLDNIDVREFAEDLISMLEQAADQFRYVPGCSIRINYTRFDGQAFTAKFGLSCSIAGQSASVTMIFKIERI
jgi:hypothetical protein